MVPTPAALNALNKPALPIGVCPLKPDLQAESTSKSVLLRSKVEISELLKIHLQFLRRLCYHTYPEHQTTAILYVPYNKHNNHTTSCFLLGDEY